MVEHAVEQYEVVRIRRMEAGGIRCNEMRAWVALLRVLGIRRVQIDAVIVRPFEVRGVSAGAASDVKHPLHLGKIIVSDHRAHLLSGEWRLPRAVDPGAAQYPVDHFTPTNS